MKKLLMVVGLFLFLAGSASSQTITTLYEGDRFPQALDVIHLASWSPFSGGDSTATYESASFDIAQYDSITYWVYARSSDGTAKFNGYLKVSFDGTTYSDTIAIGLVIDTVTVKRETLGRSGTYPTYGGVKGKISVTGDGNVTANRTDTIIDLWMVGRKRASYR